MKLNNKALMTSGGIAAAVQIVFAICGGSFGYAALAGPDVAVAIAPLAIVATVLACCGWIINLATGFGYVYFAAREDGSVQVADGAVGGAIATGVAALLGGLFSACLSLIQPFAVSAAVGGSADPGTVIGAGVGGALGAICGGLIGGAIVGAIGGLIGALTIGKPKTA